MPKHKTIIWLHAGVLLLSLFGTAQSAAAELKHQALQIEAVQPYYGDVAEDQAFILRFNQAVDPQAILPHSFCQSSAVGDQIPLRALPLNQANELLVEQSYDYSVDTAQQYIVAQCAQRLAPNSTVRLQLFDETKRNLVPRAFKEDEMGLSFDVRSPLRARLGCEKTKSTAHCNPLSPLHVYFSAPVSAHVAQGLQLIAPDGTALNATSTSSDSEQDDFIDELRFDAPRVAQAQLRWQLPADWSQLKDDAGRIISNPDFFQKPVTFASTPPLLKFAHEGIGVLERFAETPAAHEAPPALLPLALRGIAPSEINTKTGESAGQLRQLRLSTAQDMFAWYVRLQHRDYDSDIDPKTRSIFDNTNVQQQTQQLILPAAPNSADKDIELIGVPLEGTGLHVIEAKSTQLGQTYIEDNSDMYVRTAALVTNLAVHSKLSTDQLLVWVSRLDTAQPVANAGITVLSCDGTLLASGKTDKKGRWLDQRAFNDEYCPNTQLSGLFITATIEADHQDAYGQADSSFVLSTWDKGIESWRFNLPYFYGADQSEVAHTVTDRPLFLAGETVHLKHYWRGEPASGHTVGQSLPELLVRHVGSGDEITQTLQWQRSPTGGWYALSTLELAKNTTLGQYNVWLQGPQHSFQSAAFHVEAFKRPYLTGQFALSMPNSATKNEFNALIAANEAVLDIQLNYISGGVAAKQPVQISALTQRANPSFAAYEEYDFTPPEGPVRPTVVMDKTPLVLSDEGGAQLAIALSPSAEVHDLVVEASFMDPNGQVQSLQQRQTLWPAAVVVGVDHPYWEQGNSVTLKGVVLSPTGQPLAEQKVTVTGQKKKYYTTRQRMVGGFYRYDSQEQLEEMGALCEAQSNAKGEWQCAIEVSDGGQLVLHSQSTDQQGHSYTTVSSLWLGGEKQMEGAENHDRIDIIPEQKTVEPGQTVRFQVTMPFEKATALIAVEQDKVLHTEVVTLGRDAPFFDLTVQDSWGPNVYVSVLALRGRMYPETWQGFLDGGWKSPLAWYKAYKNTETMAPVPTTSIDLSKPSFRYGIAQLKVPNVAHAIKVELQPKQTMYEMGQTAQLDVKATLPSGQPAAKASLLLIGVDQALLELMANNSWDLLDAMYPPVGYAVQTATMQSEIIGRRHYGRKAVPAGGGGGGAPTREILDSLLVWRTDVVLDAEGKATIDVPLNHSLTQFELVALVDSGGSQFGVAKAQIQTHQPIQIMSGLPAVVRTSDTYDAVFTVRNREPNAVSLRLNAEGRVGGELLFNFALDPQLVAAQSSHAFKQRVTMPFQLGANSGEIDWLITASSASDDVALDQLRFSQQWQAQVPVRAQQVLWQRLFPNQPQSFALSLPDGALQHDGQYLGAVHLGLQRTLSNQSAVRAWFEQYPYTCFEQQASKYVALDDTERWQALMQELPSYLDTNNLLRYFPSPYLKGSAGLNAYILSLSAYSPETLRLPQPLAQKLLQGLHSYVEGRRDQPRTNAFEQVAFYLAALDALARYDMVPAHRLDTIELVLQQWPTSALIDGLRVLQTTKHTNIQIDNIEAVLQQRLVARGSALLFSDDNSLNSMPALMVSPVTNQARLILAVADLPQWQQTLPALVHGLLAQQYRGRWGTTTENSWALLALARVDPQPTSASAAAESLSYTIANAPAEHAKVPLDVVWSWAENGPLKVEQTDQNAAPLWLQLRSEAAVPVIKPQFNGYQIERAVTPIEQAESGQWQVGDVYEVRLTLHAEHSSVWAVINDAIPSGAVVLESPASPNSLTPSYIERLFTGYRAYVEYLPAGTSVLKYRVRLNTAGQFELPPSSVGALYDASVQAELPVPAIHVHAAP